LGGDRRLDCRPERSGPNAFHPETSGPLGLINPSPTPYVDDQGPLTSSSLRSVCHDHAGASTHPHVPSGHGRISRTVTAGDESRALGARLVGLPPVSGGGLPFQNPAPRARATATRRARARSISRKPPGKLVAEAVEDAGAEREGPASLPGRHASVNGRRRDDYEFLGQPTGIRSTPNTPPSCSAQARERGPSTNCFHNDLYLWPGRRPHYAAAMLDYKRWRASFLHIN